MFDMFWWLSDHSIAQFGDPLVVHVMSRSFDLVCIFTWLSDHFSKTGFVETKFVRSLANKVWDRVGLYWPRSVYTISVRGFKA